MRPIPRSCLAVLLACTACVVGCTETVDVSPKDAAIEPDALSLSLRLDGAVAADADPAADGAADVDPADGGADEAVEPPADGGAHDGMPSDDATAIDGGDADGQNEG